ncbi:acyltransferase [Alkalihalophilus marmarensis]|uniref:acyltransferase n=1 Tax=Alkalihalophilus marmarensis TaxID=521377 RepID=UPI00203D4D69|nr:acyltransferase [Alkalihalophilus marmarensis]MCM3489981.1 acyltransferase [Alkalihalophilus marmarensis]
MAIQKKAPIYELNVVRGLAILAVLMVHATSIAAVTLDTTSMSFFAYNAYNTFFRFGTATFILLSSFVLFYSYYHRDISRSLVTNFYKKRMLYILIPYFVFSLIYITVNSRMFSNYAGFSDFLNDFGNKLMMGSAHPHLYFVFISVQFYLLFPLFLVFLKKFPKVVKHLIWIGFVIQFAYSLLNHFYIKYPYVGSISLSYMSHYLTGAFIGIYYESIKQWFSMKVRPLFSKQRLVILGIAVIWVFAVIGHIYLYYMQRAHGVSFDSKIFHLFWSLHTYFSALVTILIGHWIYKFGKPFIVNSLTYLGMLSFGIYLIHPLFLLFYRQYVYFGNEMWQYHLWIFSCFVIALVGSILVVHPVLYKMKGGWIFFGAQPKRLKAETKANANAKQLN